MKLPSVFEIPLDTLVYDTRLHVYLPGCAMPYVHVKADSFYEIRALAHLLGEDARFTINYDLNENIYTISFENDKGKVATCIKRDDILLF